MQLKISFFNLISFQLFPNIFSNILSDQDILAIQKTNDYGDIKLIEMEVSGEENIEEEESSGSDESLERVKIEIEISEKLGDYFIFITINVDCFLEIDEVKLHNTNNFENVEGKRRMILEDKNYEGYRYGMIICLFKSKEERGIVLMEIFPIFHAQIYLEIKERMIQIDEDYSIKVDINGIKSILYLELEDNPYKLLRINCNLNLDENQNLIKRKKLIKKEERNKYKNKFIDNVVIESKRIVNQSASSFIGICLKSPFEGNYVLVITSLEHLSYRFEPKLFEIAFKIKKEEIKKIKCIKSFLDDIGEKSKEFGMIFREGMEIYIIHNPSETHKNGEIFYMDHFEYFSSRGDPQLLAKIQPLFDYKKYDYTKYNISNETSNKKTRNNDDILEGVKELFIEN
ncbi:hypothetical protein ACQ4LE_011227 [Meloidogyne hapla]|uniref:Uncharacterized protein n=1 Tax=Meloidogyne hapla TaxID=6305 RepID=A0A1I8C1R7_MELHA